MSRVNLIFRIILSAIIMWFLFMRIPLTSLLPILSSMKFSLFLISFLMLLISIILIVIRWKLLLNIFHRKSSLFELTKAYWIGCFFNFFLPSSVGGDAVKIYKAAKYYGKPLEIAASVIMDRVVGLLSLVFLGSAFMLYSHNFLDLKNSANIFVLIYASLFVFFIVIMNIKMMRKLTFVRILLTRINLYNIFKEFYLCFNIYMRHPEILIKPIIVSIVFNLTTSIQLYLLALSIGINIPIIHFLILMPIIFVIAAIPISINGLGVQDSAYIYFLGQLGVPPTLSFSFSLLVHFSRYLLGFIGGIIFIFEKNRAVKDTALN